MERKKFLENLSLGIIATPLLSSTLISCNNDDSANSSVDCNNNITKSDMLGPYYVSGSSEVTNLNTQSLPGDKIIVSGTIYGGVGNNTPVANAMIEVWHADNGGIYHPVGDGNVSDYQANQITLRGFITTNAQGQYTFESIRPGLYPGRPRHFHYKVTANGYQTLITQIYFSGDSRTADENIDNCRIIDFTQNSQGVYTGTANINLQSN
ncbi:dioxygenase family protein [Pseudofulvibacter geojedonensis]|uniref:Intradiol ring-cleavage dioxygenases domain-containing protein n=1 Tax=Pseudofulvibacter geojedonensis TaxID=1123758 RepID=A0ABW3I455_9FLAO